MSNLRFDNGICDECDGPLDSRGLCCLCNADIYDFSYQDLEDLRKETMEDDNEQNKD